MNYDVEWTSEAENDLASIWNAASDLKPVTEASAWLDAHLAIDPLHSVEPWTSSVHRIGVRDPVGIEFEVIEHDKSVIVHSIFSIG
jgi:hypothetical protein